MKIEHLFKRNSKSGIVTYWVGILLLIIVSKGPVDSPLTWGGIAVVLLVLISLEMKFNKSPMSSHDKQIWRTISEAVYSEQFLYFLKNTDFRGSFSEDEMEPLRNLCRFDEMNDIYFLDGKIQKSFLELRDIGRELKTLIATWHLPADNNGIAKIDPKADEKQVLADVKRMNEKATVLYNLIIEFRKSVMTKNMDD